ncbi:MAG: hypothetical protein WBP26_04745 [Candidatus Saccharimonadales bacterium]
MGKSKQLNRSADKADTLAVRTAPDTPLVARRAIKKKLVVLVAVLVGFILVALFAVFVWFKEDRPVASDSSSQESFYKTESAAEPVSNNYEGDQKVLDQQLAAATTAEQKAALYSQKSALVVINKGYQDAQALEFAQHAEALASSPVTALGIATIYQMQSKTSKALAAFELYMSRVDDTYKAAHPGEFEHYQAVVKELEKQ